MSGNNLNDEFPWAYFASDSFQKLEFINVNFNPFVEVPESCIRHAYCYKRTLMNTGDGNELPRVDPNLDNLISRSYDEKEYLFISL